ncbi:phosphoribosyltransferase [Devosia sp. XGJD_8]|uniref:phosphoribosyltransferase n=1 Tax=Devosia sp. XGJD_8 TaxID=3391187 RepID=UPI003984664F
MAEALRLSSIAQQRGRHTRVAWTAADPAQVLIHCRYDQLKGTAKDSPFAHEKYLKAKRYNDKEAAADIVEALIDDHVVDQIIDLLPDDRAVKVVFPYPEFDPDIKSPNQMTITNAIPFAFAAHLAALLDAEIEVEIVEAARPGRTDLNRFERFLWQPCFTGKVDPDCVYVLVDDTCTLGGTFAALRSYILAKGGTVVAVTALSHMNGKSVPFGIADGTANMLVSRYSEEISAFWIEEVGHGIECLSELEGSFLVEWQGYGGKRAGTEPLQQLRDRLVEAKASGRGNDRS